MSAITPKQAAYLSFLGATLPTTSAEAAHLIQTLHDNKDDALWERCELWKVDRAWLHPDLYPGELAKLQNSRADAIRSFNNDERGIGCPLKRITKAQVQQIINYLDANYAGWDRHLWLPFMSVSPDVFHDYFVAAAWHVNPELFKKGYSPIGRSSMNERRQASRVNLPFCGTSLQEHSSKSSAKLSLIVVSMLLLLAIIIFIFLRK